MIYAVETITDYDAEAFTRNLDAAIDRWQAERLEIEVQYQPTGRRTHAGVAHRALVQHNALLIMRKP